jgi:hypothetical protein
MAVKARRHKHVKQLEGRVVKTEAKENDAIVLYYDNDGLTDKYVIELSLSEYFNRDEYDHYTHLAIEKLVPPFAMYNTLGNGEPSRLIMYIFEHELGEYLAEQGVDSVEWYSRIFNGDRYYFGVVVNNMVIMRTKEEK